MAFSLKLKAAATAITNPAPSTLTTSNPFPAPYVDQKTASTAWATQASTNSNALTHRGGLDGRGVKALGLAFNPSGGASVTYTVTIWAYFNTINAWVNPVDYGVYNLKGPQSILIENVYPVPYFVQLSNISSGNVDIWYDGEAQLL